MEGNIGELGEEAGVKVTEVTAIIADADGPAWGAKGTEVSDRVGDIGSAVGGGEALDGASRDIGEEDGGVGSGGDEVREEEGKVGEELEVEQKGISNLQQNKIYIFLIYSD